MMLADILGKVVMLGIVIAVVAHLLATGTALAGIGELPVAAYEQRTIAPSPNEPHPPPRPPAPSVATPHRPVLAPRQRPSILPVERHDWLSVPSVSLSVGLADYRDCTAVTPLTRVSGARDWCVPEDVTLLIGHNPGVFTPLAGAREGAAALYWDHMGHETEFRIQAVSRLSKADADARSQEGSPRRLIMITCAVPDGSLVWMLVAVPTSG